MQSVLVTDHSRIQVQKKAVTFIAQHLLHYFSLLLVLLSLVIFVPARQTAEASPSIVQVLLRGIKEVNYYPADNAWTDMWTRFNPQEINHDFALIQAMGFNTVRIILQATSGAFDYPVPTTAERSKLSQVIALAIVHHLRVHLTLFDGWSQYRDITGSKQWARAIVAPYAGDARVSIIELQNEMPLAVADSLSWAQTMIPYLRTIDGGIPITISASGLARMANLINALRPTPPDFYDFHLYEYDGRVYNTLKQVKALLQGAPFLTGEIGYSTYPGSQAGFSGVAQNSVAQEAQQEYYYRMVFYATESLGLPFPAPWILSDFSSEAFPGPPQPATRQQAYFGLLRVDGSKKPAADTITRMLAGNPVGTSFNNGFEQSDGQGLPTLWRIAQSASAGFTADFAWDGAVAHSGRASARISNSTTSKYGTASLFLNPIQNVVPGQIYHVLVWARGLHATGRNDVSMLWFDATGVPLSQAVSASFPAGTFAWQQRILVARAPAQAAGIEIHLNSQGNSGTVWFDDVAFGEGT